jgi:hypothetical protein
VQEWRTSPFLDTRTGQGNSNCIFLSQHIIDIGSTGQPRLVGQLEEVSMPQRSFSLHGHVLLCDVLGGLYIYDTSKPDHPKTKVSFPDQGRLWNVSVSAGHAYAVGDAGLHVLDVRNPEKPRLLETLGTRGYPRALTAVSNFVYLASGATGVEIFETCAGMEAENERKARALSVTSSGTNRPARLIRKFPAEKPAGSEPPTFTAREVEVLEALFEYEFGKSTNMIVLKGETDLWHLSDYRSQFKKGAEQEAEKDFLRRNQKSVRIVWPGTAPKHVALLSKPTLDSLFSGKHAKHEAGWDAFYEQFPAAHGITGISHVGFDSTGTVAIVYCGTQSHYLAGSGGMLLLRLKGGKWVVEKEIGPFWVS